MPRPLKIMLWIVGGLLAFWSSWGSSERSPWNQKTLKPHPICLLRNSSI